MADHKSIALSESEEMYLITIARLVEQGHQRPIPISHLAEELAIQPVSANQMVHKLADDGLVTYTPYRGVDLTEEGSRVTSVVLRRRRLWEVFLVNYLEVQPAEADALACRLEHITPGKVIDQLDDFLSHPKTSPQGLPIPAAILMPSEPQIIEEQPRPLNEQTVGEEGKVIRLEADSVTQEFLIAAGLRPGALIRPLAISSCGAMLIQAGENRIHLDADLSGNVLVAIKPGAA